MEHPVHIIQTQPQETALDLSVSYHDLKDKLTGNLRESSIKMYQHSIKFYQQFCNECGYHPLDPQTLQEWIAKLMTSGNAVEGKELSPYTINRMISAVKRLINQMAEEHMIDELIAIKFQRVRKVSVKSNRERISKRTKRKKTRIPPKVMRMICEAPDVSQLKGLRDRALLFTLATSGVRCEEVAKLLVEHVIEEERELTEEEWERYGHKPEKLADLQHGYVIKVIGKTDTGLRTAPLSPEAYTYIQAWLTARAGQVDSPYVFTSFTTRKFIPQNRHMGRNSVWDVVKRYAGQCGYPDITTHDFRRYVGTRLAKINPTTAKNALGHASVQTTIDHYDLNELELNITKNIL